MNNTRTLKLLAGASILTGVTFGCVATADATKPNPEHTVTICHSGNGKHFTEIEVDYAGALGHAKTDDDDIIPAFEDFPGQNLDKENPCSIQLTSTTQTTLIMSTTSTTTTENVPTTVVTVPVTRTTTTLLAPSTTVAEVTTTWTNTSTTAKMVPVTATTAQSTTSSTATPTTKAPATSVSPTTAPISITVTSPQTPATEPSTSLPPSLSPSKQQPEQITSLPVTGSNSFLLSVLAGAMITFGAILIIGSKND